MACTDRECSVCYSEEGPFQSLSCGHEFCYGCIKQWYLKGTGTGCPMCRKPIYFKGFHKVRDQWDEDAWETRCTEALNTAFDECIAEAIEMAGLFPRKYRAEILGGVTNDLRDIEKTFRFLKSEALTAEDIEYVLTECADYYSDRHIDRIRYLDEPVKEFASQYPCVALASAGSPCRTRARQDPWCTVSFFIEV